MDRGNLLSIMLATLCTLKLTQGQLGVVYSPFVKPEDSPTSESYTLEDVKVMMDLVKDDNYKFVATYGVGAPNEPYKPNQTRYHSSSVVRTALVAAEINKKHKSLRLSVFQGIYKNSLREQLNSEIKVAFEMAHAANSIFAGSVSGLIFPSTAGFYQLFDMGEILSNVSKMARNQGLQFGVRVWNCGTTIGTVDKKDGNYLQLISLFDFIICTVMPKESSYSQGPEVFFKEVTNGILKVEENMREMRKETNIMVETGWASILNESNGRELNDMKTFWEMMGQWANEEKKLVFMSEAFDNPWKMSVKDVHLAAHYGLWRHLETEDNSRKAYARKVLEVNTHNQPRTSAAARNKKSFCGLTTLIFLLGGFVAYSYKF